MLDVNSDSASVNSNDVPVNSDGHTVRSDALPDRSDGHNVRSDALTVDSDGGMSTLMAVMSTPTTYPIALTARAATLTVVMLTLAAVRQR